MHRFYSELIDAAAPWVAAVEHYALVYVLWPLCQEVIVPLHTLLHVVWCNPAPDWETKYLHIVSLQRLGPAPRMAHEVPFSWPPAADHNHDMSAAGT